MESKVGQLAKLNAASLSKQIDKTLSRFIKKIKGVYQQNNTNKKGEHNHKHTGLFKIMRMP